MFQHPFRIFGDFIISHTFIEHFYKFGKYLGSFCFFAGALLADFSLSSNRPTDNVSENTSRMRNLFREIWPIGLVLFGLLLGSVPPENPEFSPWSRFIVDFFEEYITASDSNLCLH